jgi:hypothetical protein
VQKWIVLLPWEREDERPEREREDERETKIVGHCATANNFFLAKMRVFALQHINYVLGKTEFLLQLITTSCTYEEFSYMEMLV